MKSKVRNIYKKHFSQFRIILGLLFLFVTAVCVTAPKLAPENRKQDIQFLAD